MKINKIIRNLLVFITREITPEMKLTNKTIIGETKRLLADFRDLAPQEYGLKDPATGRVDLEIFKDLLTETANLGIEEINSGEYITNRLGQSTKTNAMVLQERARQNLAISKIKNADYRVFIVDFDKFKSLSKEFRGKLTIVLPDLLILLFLDFDKEGNILGFGRNKAGRTVTWRITPSKIVDPTGKIFIVARKNLKDKYFLENEELLPKH